MSNMINLRTVKFERANYAFVAPSVSVSAMGIGVFVRDTKKVGKVYPCAC